MSYFIDTKYLNQISHRLSLFVQKKKDLWNCRCMLCGDSQTNKKKARGYFYRQKNDLYYKCHNCSASQHFGTFLKYIDPMLYQQYVFERYSKGENGPKAHKNGEKVFKFEQPVFRKKQPTLDTIAQRLDTLDNTHEAILYCQQRNIPVDKYKQLYYIEHTKNIAKLAPDYDNITSEEPRIILPFYNERGVLTGLTMRGIRGEHLRYIMIKIVDSETMIFGLHTVDKTKPIKVVEGPIDSLFLDNAIACNGTAFSKIETLDLHKDNLTIIFDNQPRNGEVCKIVEKYVNLGFNVCIWPCGLIEKDINDMVNAGHDVEKIIIENTFNGLMAKLKLTEWRNC